MNPIILNSEQVKLAGQGGQEIPVCDENGTFVGNLVPDCISPEQIQAALKSKTEKGKRLTTPELLRHLESLSEYEKKNGPLTGEQAVELTRAMLTEDNA